MTYLYLVFLGAVGVLLAAGVLEQRKHLAHLHRIEQRVLVNGIRGKSSITRLCAGALRGGGLVTTAKTTGTAARFIHPDGSEEPVYRKWGIANVVEQIGIVRRAAAYRSDVLVIECMAVMPDLQEINQSKLIQSTIGVLCNVREDHLAEMGPTLDDVARSLSRSMPVGGVCVTAERERLEILQQEADKRDCELIAVDPESVTDAEMAGFSWVTFKENVAIALKVAELLGVNRQLALTGMWSAPPDPGVLSVQTRAAGDKRVKLANVFAANDPESTLMNIERLLDQGSISAPLHVVINCRPDRVERNRQMGALIAEIAPDRVILIGDPTRSARVSIDDKWQDRVNDLGGARPAHELLDAILADIDTTASLVTIGNIHGQGELLLEVFEGLEEVPADAADQAPPAPAPIPPDPRRPEPVFDRGRQRRHGPPPGARPPGLFPGQRPPGQFSGPRPQHSDQFPGPQPSGRFAVPPGPGQFRTPPPQPSGQVPAPNQNSGPRPAPTRPPGSDSRAGIAHPADPGRPKPPGDRSGYVDPPTQFHGPAGDPPVRSRAAQPPTESPNPGETPARQRAAAPPDRELPRRPRQPEPPTEFHGAVGESTGQSRHARPQRPHQPEPPTEYRGPVDPPVRSRPPELPTRSRRVEGEQGGWPDSSGEPPARGRRRAPEPPGPPVRGEVEPPARGRQVEGDQEWARRSGGRREPVQKPHVDHPDPTTRTRPPGQVDPSERHQTPRKQP
ncbi:poly-gamma-glutamate synthase PgsB [Actinokineospora globicatena]|uniref:poly-gamma-glutamate synthase PgsB n=1 Tax=Actinokineospora globicatena TaxID=103729 RepID=UPI0020A32B3A|nr:poly-gamma-glutamate synthase PgsB [Actinokineospora globicatena]MCP2303049.1 poly-gamma-glutamate synthase PgsB/CapB [Actinokineospora globicatena]GLW79839.1 hypothetical protein Aglo01_43200 [Actinokineospora globicatena]GLW85751.1 hypothetical protein Aglo02_33910 [Actinokineospora globicatena]